MPRPSRSAPASAPASATIVGGPGAEPATRAIDAFTAALGTVDPDLLLACGDRLSGMSAMMRALQPRGIPAGETGVGADMARLFSGTKAPSRPDHEIAAMTLMQVAGAVLFDGDPGAPNGLRRIASIGRALDLAATALAAKPSEAELIAMAGALTSEPDSLSMEEASARDGAHIERVFAEKIGAARPPKRHGRG